MYPGCPLESNTECFDLVLFLQFYLDWDNIASRGHPNILWQPKNTTGIHALGLILCGTFNGGVDTTNWAKLSLDLSINMCKGWQTNSKCQDAIPSEYKASHHDNPGLTSDFNYEHWNVGITINLSCYSNLCTPSSTDFRTNATIITPKLDRNSSSNFEEGYSLV